MVTQPAHSLCDKFFDRPLKLGEKGRLMKDKIKKKIEVNMPMPRIYFFFAGAFFASFLTVFLATEITSGCYICEQFVFIIC